MSHIMKNGIRNLKLMDAGVSSIPMKVSKQNYKSEKREWMCMGSRNTNQMATRYQDTFLKTAYKYYHQIAL